MAVNGRQWQCAMTVSPWASRLQLLLVELLVAVLVAGLEDAVVMLEEVLHLGRAAAL